MDTLYSEAEAVEMLRVRVEPLVQSTVAAEMDISPQLLCDVLKGRRPIPEQALVYLGLEEVGRMFRPKQRVGVAKKTSARKRGEQPTRAENPSIPSPICGDGCPECGGLRKMHQKGCKRG